MSPTEFVADLFNPDLAFLAKALAVAVMSSIVCGVVGCHVVLRGMAFIGDAVAHAVFPGVAIAFVVQGSLVVGGTIAGVVTAVLVAIFSHDRRIKEDAIIGVFFVAAFALGIVVISRAPGYGGSLQQFLFGSITGIPDRDVYVVGITGLVILGAAFLGHKELVAVSLDREMARSMGLRVFWLDLALYVGVTLAVVISLQTIGNILVLALLITPAATARLLTDRLGLMMLLSPLVGATSATIGLYLSWSYDLPVGGTSVLVLTAAFLVAWVGAPRHGLVAKALRPRRGRPIVASALALTLVAGVAIAAGAPASATGDEPVEHDLTLALTTGDDGQLAWQATTTADVALPPHVPDGPGVPGVGDVPGAPGVVSVDVPFEGAFPATIDVGWQLATLDPAPFRSDVVQVDLEAFEGTGRFTATAPSPFGGTWVLLDPDDGVDGFVLQLGRDGSTAWSFEAPGTYQLELTVTAPLATGGVTSATTGIHVTVGDGPAPDEAPALPAPDRSPDPSAPISPDAPPPAPSPAPSAADPEVGADRATGAPAPTAPSPLLQAEPELAAPAQVSAPAGTRVVIDDGHVDMGPRFVDGSWRVQLRDDTGSPVVWRDLADVVLHAGGAARIQVPPGDAYAFLGSPGSTVYVLPQVQQAGLVWPGWNTQDPSVVEAVPGSVTWRLRGVDGPGRFLLYLTGTFGQSEILFDTGAGLPQDLAIARNVHAHGNWAFTEPGIYRLTVEMAATTADGAPLSDTRVLTIVVGDEIDPATAFTPDPTLPDDPTDPTTPPPGGTGGPGETDAPGTGTSGGGSAGGSSGGGSSTAGGGTGSSSPTSGGSLVRTGLDGAGTKAAVALALVAFGAALVVATRTRRR
jgi:manganese/iron transport system permease protein